MALTVGPDCLGTSEESWHRSGWIEQLAVWRLPPCRSVVVVAPHPDDEALGVGGLLQHLGRQAAAIELVAVTDGESSHARSGRITGDRLAAWRRRERDEALCRLGLSDIFVTSLHLPDGRVADSEAMLGAALARRLGPDTLCVAPWRHDGHPDHDACGRAAAAAAADNSAVLAEYLVWAWHWATPDDGQIPAGRARRFGLSYRDWSRKRWAIDAFRSQLDSLGPAPEDGPILPAAIVERFRRRHEVVLV
jgi:LmbE family N-acetylglucosaminyl deacetylase